MNQANQLVDGFAPDKSQPSPRPTPFNSDPHRTMPVYWATPEVLYGLHVMDLQNLPEICLAIKPPNKITGQIVIYVL